MRRWSRGCLLILLGVILSSVALIGPPTAYAASYTVTNLNDSGSGSLRQAILNANAFSSDDTITFTTSGTITLTSGVLTLANNGTLTIDGGGAITISGNHASQVLYVNTGANVTLKALTITDGSESPSGGGGIRNNGILTVIGSTISNNTSVNTGGGILNYASTLTVINSTIAGNTGYWGGGIYNNHASTVTVINSTIAGNTATATSGGGIYNASGSTLTLNNSILANNGTDLTCGVGTINAQNSLIKNGLGCVNGTKTNNLGGVNPSLGALTGSPAYFPLNSGSPAIDAGSNGLLPADTTDLDNDGNTSELLPLDQAGNARVQGVAVDMGAYETTGTVSISPASANVVEGASTNFTITRTGSTVSALAVMVNITPGTGMTASDYNFSGGLTGSLSGAQTVTIPTGQVSVVVTFNATDDVDAEPDNTLTIALVDDTTYNLGTPASATVTIPANDTVVTNLNDSGEGSLRQAVANANAFSSDDTITFTVSGTITLTSGQLTLANNGALTIDGGGVITISGNGASRVFSVASGAEVTLDGLGIGDGATSGNGGGILNNGTLTVSDSSVGGNLTTGSGRGGGIYNNGTLTISASTFDGNLTTGSGGNSGGGIYNLGTLVVTDSSLTHNTAHSSGGAIFNLGGTLTITSSTLSSNSANGGGGLVVNGGSGSLVNSTVAANSASLLGGGVVVSNSASFSVLDSTLSNNSSAGGSGSGGGVYVSDATLTLDNSIVANSTNGDCVQSDGTINAQSSLIEDGLGCVTNDLGGNLTGDPSLGTFTGVCYPLNSGSIAIDAGDNALVPVDLTTDEAGNPRIQGAAVDLGAYEATLLTITPDTASVPEGSSTEVTITRTGSTTGAMTVNLTITPGDANMTLSDYLLTGGSISGQTGSVTITIPAGSASATVNFAALADNMAEPDNTLTIALVSGSSYLLGTTDQRDRHYPGQRFDRDQSQRQRRRLAAAGGRQRQRLQQRRHYHLHHQRHDHPDQRAVDAGEQRRVDHRRRRRDHHQRERRQPGVQRRQRRKGDARRAGHRRRRDQRQWRRHPQRRHADGQRQQRRRQSDHRQRPRRRHL